MMKKKSKNQVYLITHQYNSKAMYTSRIKMLFLLRKTLTQKWRDEWNNIFMMKNNLALTKPGKFLSIKMEEVE
jgi:hypothetical protein